MIKIMLLLFKEYLIFYAIDKRTRTPYTDSYVFDGVTIECMNQWRRGFATKTKC